MSAVRQWVGGFIIVAGTVTIAPRVMAQQEGTTPDSVPLAARVDDLEQQIRVLKRLRELETDSIANAASIVPRSVIASPETGGSPPTVPGADEIVLGPGRALSSRSARRTARGPGATSRRGRSRSSCSPPRPSRASSSTAMSTTPTGASAKLYCWPPRAPFASRPAASRR